MRVASMERVGAERERERAGHKAEEGNKFAVAISYGRWRNFMECRD